MDCFVVDVILFEDNDSTIVLIITIIIFSFSVVLVFAHGPGS